MADKLYQVFFKSKQWQVKEAAARCAAGKFADKAQAVACAKELAKAAPGRVEILAEDGSVEKQIAATG